MKRLIFTVITPTFNSARTLFRVFDSLRDQTFKQFEWVVVDDGSTDETHELIEQYIQQSTFPIIYIWQENSHKKTAVNRGVEKANGQLVLVADDDDEIPARALEIMYDYWNKLPSQNKSIISGVTGLCVDQKGNLVGDQFPSEVMESTNLDISILYNVNGEKWGFKRRDIMIEFPYPEDIPGYVPESLVWSRIDRQYKTLFVNDVFRIYHMDRQYNKLQIRGREAKMKCIGRRFAAQEALLEDFPTYFRSPIQLAKLSTNYVRYSMHARCSVTEIFGQIKGYKQQITVFLFFIIGYLIYKRDSNF